MSCCIQSFGVTHTHLIWYQFLNPLRLPLVLMGTAFYIHFRGQVNPTCAPSTYLDIFGFIFFLAQVHRTTKYLSKKIVIIKYWKTQVHIDLQALCQNETLCRAEICRRNLCFQQRGNGIKFLLKKKNNNSCFSCMCWVYIGKQNCEKIFVSFVELHTNIFCSGL